MNRALIIGVMGPGASASKANTDAAAQLGVYIATRGWVLLSGGRSEGVMEAANQAAAAAGGLTLGLLPGETCANASPSVILALPTGLGHTRNVLNITASDVVLVCGFGLGAGTLSEVAFALKYQKPLIVISDAKETHDFLRNFSSPNFFLVSTVSKALNTLDGLVVNSDDFRNRRPIRFTSEFLRT